jgi:solute carrier family 13 (sodium-dependent dicarboxylate transporter), member 2/3/5
MEEGKGSKWWLVALALACVPASSWLPLEAAGEGLDPARVRLGLGILACVALLWVSEALPLAATALLVPVLGALTGVMELKTSLTSFADPVIFLFFGGFALATAMSAQGLDRRLAAKVMRAGKGGFVRVSCMLFAMTAGFSMWMSNTATTAMMIPLALGILAMMPQDALAARRSAFLLLGTAYAASIGGLGTLVGTPPNGIAAAALGIGFGGWLRFGLPAMVLLLPLMVLVLLGVFRPGAARVETIGPADDFEWNRGRILALAVFALSAGAWMAGGFLGPLLGLGSSFDPLVALLAVLMVAATRVASWKDIEKGTEWGVLLLFGGGIALSRMLDGTGAGMFLARSIVGISEGWPPLALIGASLLLVILLGEFASNTASAALLVPVFMAVAGEAGMAPATLVVPVAIASSCGFMLPVATPPNAMVFATGRIRQRDMLRAGLLLDVIALVVLALLARWVF